MKVLLAHLRRLVDLPESARDVRSLLDDVGVEVKRVNDGPDGPVLTVELLANRGDHYAYAGIAREVHGRTGAPLRLPKPAALERAPATRARVDVDAEACPAYSLTPLTVKSGAGALPAEVRAVLEAAALASELPIVDATNFVNLELGQPLHAFDADRVTGTVTVRFSRAGEEALLLGTKEKTKLLEGTLVIADDVKILAVAGVIGCEDSAMHAGSKKVLLESATFDPVLVRKASRALNVATDAGARFMRGGDPTLPAAGAERAIEILAASGVVEPASKLEVARAWGGEALVLEISVAGTNTAIGANLDAGAMKGRLERYGFQVAPKSSGAKGDALAVTVPPHRRWDVKEIADVHEELAKSIGYGALRVEVPAAVRGASPSARETFRRAVDELLVGYGFYEIFTSGFYGRGALAKLELPDGDPLAAHVETINALDRDYTLLKNNAIIHALETVGENLDVRLSDIRAHEWTRTFHPDSAAPNGFSTETELLWMVACGAAPSSWRAPGAPLDFHFLKGLLEELRLLARVDLKLDPDAPHRLDRLLHPQRRAAVLLGGAPVGVLGELHPSLLKSFRVKHARPTYLELEWPRLLSPLPRRYAEPPALLPARRDLCFDAPRGVTADALASTMRKASSDIAPSIEVTDVFEDAKRRSVTFAIVFPGGEGTTNASMNETCQRLADAVAGEWSARGVRLRAAPSPEGG